MAERAAQRRDRLCRRSSCRRSTALLGAADHRPHRRHLHPQPATSPACCASAALLLARLPRRRSSPPTCRRRRWAASGAACCSTLRNALFTKLQELPLDFFNQNKAGDLISRINNDTDKLNQFFAQALVQLAGNLFLMAGAAIFLVSLNLRLGLAALAPALGVLLIVTRADRAVGEAEERQEPAGARRPERRDPGEPQQLQGHRRLQPPRLLPAEVRRGQPAQLRRVGRAGLASNVFMPIYGLAYNLAQLIVLAYGIHLIAVGQLHGRPADRLPAVRQQLLPAAAAAGGRLVVVPAGAGRPRSHLGGAGARIEHAGAARANRRGRRRAPGVRARRRSAIPAAAKCCTTPRSRSSAARPTRWSGRPAAARPRPRR